MKTTMMMTIFALFISGCGVVATTTRNPYELIRELPESEMRISETEIETYFVVDGDQADRVLSTPAPVTIFGAYSPEEIRASLEVADATEFGCQRTRVGDREAIVCLP